jgi:hypothetical protein
MRACKTRNAQLMAGLIGFRSQNPPKISISPQLLRHFCLFPSSPILTLIDRTRSHPSSLPLLPRSMHLSIWSSSESIYNLCSTSSCHCRVTCLSAIAAQSGHPASLLRIYS